MHAHDQTQGNGSSPGGKTEIKNIGDEVGGESENEVKWKGDYNDVKITELREVVPQRIVIRDLVTAPYRGCDGSHTTAIRQKTL